MQDRGLLPNSTNGFGNVKVNGLNLVPYPPTKINPFMMCDVCDEERKMCWKFFFFFGSVTDYMLDEKKYTRKNYVFLSFEQHTLCLGQCVGLRQISWWATLLCNNHQATVDDVLFSGKAYHVPEIKNFQNAYKKNLSTKRTRFISLCITLR